MRYAGFKGNAKIPDVASLIRATLAGEPTLSFRNSLSNPYPLQGQPVFPPGGQYIELDPLKLPQGSVTIDNNPPGHLSVQPLQIDVLREAIIGRGRFPR